MSVDAGSGEREGWTAVDAVAGLLASISIFASALGLVWRPIRIVPFAIILAVGAFVPMGAGLRLFGALGVLVVAIVFAFQLDSALGDVGGDLGSSLDTGFYLAVISAIVGVASAFVPSARSARR